MSVSKIRTTNHPGLHPDKAWCLSTVANLDSLQSPGSHQVLDTLSSLRLGANLIHPILRHSARYRVRPYFGPRLSRGSRRGLGSSNLGL